MGGNDTFVVVVTGGVFGNDIDSFLVGGDSGSGSAFDKEKTRSNFAIFAVFNFWVFGSSNLGRGDFCSFFYNLGL